jgi:lysyl-tRNA synthetase, class II
MSEHETSHLNEEEVRSQKRAQLIADGHNPYKYSFKKTHHCQDIHHEFGGITNEDKIEATVNIAGRLMAKRGHGKAMFGNIQDDSNSIQFYININGVDASVFETVDHFDIGDIVSLSGTPFRTNRGELSIRIISADLLTKALLPLPEKYHGLQDKELRYRMRYLDLIANPDVRATFKKRSAIVASIRHFLEQDDFMEVETPVLNNTYGGASARPFTTHHNELKQDLFLRISLELPLKRLIVGGFEKVFEIGRVFRNEGVSYKHNPEYTLLELYQAYADYEDMMTLTETLLSELVKKQTGTYLLQYQGQAIDFTPPFKRYTFKTALKDFADVDMNDYEALFKKASELNLDPIKGISKGTLIMDIYDECVESKLIQPTFMMDHPWETSPLAKKHRHDY